jgi:hypothetical protein
MKWYRLTAGVVLCLAVTACGSVTRTGVSASATRGPTVASSARASASASTAASGSSTALQPPASSSASVASSTVWFDCTHHGQVEPSNYILTCASAGSVLEHLVWKSWTAQQAVAAGVHALNNCTPNCAEGKFIDYPVIITLWRGEPVSGQRGEQYFTRITARYTERRPPAYTSNGQLVRHPAEWTEPLGPVGT